MLDEHNRGGQQGKMGSRRNSIQTNSRFMFNPQCNNSYSRKQNVLLIVFFGACLFPFQNSMGNTSSVHLMLSKSPRSELEVAASLYPGLPVPVIREVLFYHQNSMNNTSSVPLMLSKSTRSELEVAALLYSRLAVPLIREVLFYHQNIFTVQVSLDFLRSQFMNHKGRFTCPECGLHLKFAFHGFSVDEVSHEKLLPDVIKTHVESHASESEIRVYNVSGEEMKANGAYGIRALFVK